MGSKTFFTFDTNYPFYDLAPSADRPNLLFSMYFKLGAVGQKHILTQVADSALIATLSNQVSTNKADISALKGSPKTLSSRSIRPTVEATVAPKVAATTSTQLGPSDGAFFMVTLDNKESFSGLNYYASMQMGTKLKKDVNLYVAPNSGMNVTYGPTHAHSQLSFNAASTQLMSLSTQKYATQVILEDAITHKKCKFECPYVKGWEYKNSKTFAQSDGEKIQSYTFK